MKDKFKKDEIANNIDFNQDNQITVIGAKEHNLKNVNIDIPKNQLVVLLV